MLTCSHGHENCCFPAMIKDGDCYLLYAAKGAGKTTASLILGWDGKRHGYLIVSNIRLMRWSKKTNDFEEVDRTANYVYVDTFESFVWELLKFLRERSDPTKAQHMIFILDEVTLSLIRAGKTVLDPFVQAAIGLSAMTRKIHLAQLLLTQSQQLVSTKFRGIEAGLVTGFLTKPSMAGYSAREVLQWELPNPDNPYTPDGKVILRKVPTSVGPLVGWARTPEMIRNPDGTYQEVPIFNTEAIAKFGMGNFTRGRRAGQPFDLQGLLSECAGKLPKHVPKVIEAFLLGEIGGKPAQQPVAVPMDESDGDEDDDDDEEPEEEEQVQDETAPQKKGEGVKQLVIDLLIEGGHSQSEIGRLAGCSRQYVFEVKKELKAIGRLS